MALQNRVTPFGAIISNPARGTMMGNRGGRLHDASQTLGRSRWKSRAWIICVLDFRGRHRKVMDNSYTELFFLDEATALASGHRPCFECRRAAAKSFQAAWKQGNRCSAIPTAPAMDLRLHTERMAVVGRENPAVADVTKLPPGTLVAGQGEAWLIHDNALHQWTIRGYGEKRQLSGRFEVLTPLSTVGVLCGGYRPDPHNSVEDH